MVKKSSIAMLLIFPIVVGIWIIGEMNHIQTSKADGIATYSEYRNNLPKPDSAKLIEVGEQPHLLFFGPIASGVAIVSGPPGYAFDLSGNLVDWSGDIGDDSRFSRKWNPYQDGSIGIAKAEDMLTGKRKDEAR